MSSISESFSLNSLSLPKSVRSETKDKFDAILKAAASKKKRTKSKEKLLDDLESTTASSRNLYDQDEDLNRKRREEEEERASKKIILNKFLNDSTSLGASNTTDNTVVTLVKPPVPKPRKKKLEEQRRDSVTSTGTFEVTSPKILLSPNKKCINIENLRRDSASSVRTFEVTSPKIQHNSHTIAKDNDKNIQIIGDLVLHDSPTTSKTNVYANKSEILEKADNETLVDRNSSKSNSSRGTFILDKNSDIEKELKTNNSKVILGKKETTKNELDIVESGKEDEKIKPNVKKRLHKKNHTIESSNQQGSTSTAGPYDYQNITEIKIHKTDKLLLKSFVIHPVVKIHIVDIRTGKYFKKSDKNRPVVFYYEDGSNDYILPVMSSYYNLQEKRSFYPMWEDTVLLNEDFQYIINEHVIIFFELMDFATTNFGTLRRNKDCEKGWYKIAFSFLKVVGKNNAQNVNKKVRLQLYYPQATSSKKMEYNTCELWDWWRSKKLKKYPSTLYITIKKVISPTKVIETFRSKTPLQKEQVDRSIVDETNNDDLIDDQIKQDADNLKVKWQKRFNEVRKLPEECAFQLETFEEGCFVLKFSNNGSYLACSVRINDDFQIIVYWVNTFEELYRFKSHQALIYSVSWSKDDKYLLSASSDNTVAIWNFESKSFFQILPHPSFVYTSEINVDNVIATGSYDRTLRIWNFNEKNNEFELYQELENHKGYVTTLCFSHTNSDFLYSADSSGKINEWNKKGTDWELNRKLDIVDLRETKINQILLFPNDKKMLVHSRDSALRIISIANVCVIRWLHGALNTRVQTFCDISPKWSSYIAAGSENGLVVIWDANTGKDIKTYEGFSNKSKAAHCVQFHPHSNMLAISHYGSNEPILIYYDEEDEELSDKEQNGKNARFKQNNETDVDVQQEKLDFRKVLEKMDQLLA